MVFFRLKYFLHIINQVNKRIRVRDMLVNATFNNISVISVEETGVPGENHLLVASHWQTLSHIVVSRTPRHERGSNSQL